MTRKLQPQNVAQEVAWRNLSAKQIRTLRKQGIEVVDSSLGDVYDMAPRLIHLVKDDTLCVRSAPEVRAIADGNATLVLDITIEEEAEKIEKAPAKSTGHIGFAHGMEYYWRNGELYRAPVNNPVFPDGFRCGRWHSSAHTATYFLQQVGLA